MVFGLLLLEELQKKSLLNGTRILSMLVYYKFLENLLNMLQVIYIPQLLQQKELI